MDVRDHTQMSMEKAYVKNNVLIAKAECSQAQDIYIFALCIRCYMWSLRDERPTTN